MMKPILNGPGYNCLVRAKYGHILYNRHDTYIGKAIEKYGEFSEGEVNLFRQICGKGDIVIDVGANIGAHTLVFSRLVGQQGRVHAFEPQRVVFQTLCANMAINSIENVECRQTALSSESSTTRIPDIRYDLPANHGGFKVGDYEKGMEIPVEPLDSLLDLSRLKLIKIDVEGMEYHVIQGARDTIARHTPFLYVENDKPRKSKVLIQLIQSLGYRLFWHLPGLFNPNNFARDPENIYGDIVSVNMLCVSKALNLNFEGFREITDPGQHPLQSNPHA